MGIGWAGSPSRKDAGWLDRAYARLSVTTIRKHKHHLIMRCLCFRIVVTLITPAARPASNQPTA